jgi:hypothetical protein
MPYLLIVISLVEANADAGSSPIGFGTQIVSHASTLWQRFHCTADTYQWKMLKKLKISVKLSPELNENNVTHICHADCKFRAVDLQYDQLRYNCQRQGNVL